MVPTAFETAVDPSLEKEAGSVAAQQQASKRSRKQWQMISVIVGLPVLACLLAFVLTYSQWFRKHADSQWIQSSDRVFTAHDIPCDVLVYGDSSAITGVDPAIVQQRTGLRTCNVAQTKAVIVVLGTKGLDLFLAHNPKPRYLVLQFTGADFYKPESWKDTTAYMEGVVPLLRYYSKRDFILTTLRHPEIIMGMMHYAYVTGPSDLWTNRRHLANLTSNTPLIDVHFVRSEPTQTNCALVDDLDPTFHTPDPVFVQQLREKYAHAADHLLIDASPLSTCDPKFNYISQHLHGLSNTLERYPPELFNEGYSHYTKAGAQRVSEELAQQIQSIQQQAIQKQAPQNQAVQRRAGQPGVAGTDDAKAEGTLR